MCIRDSFCTACYRAGRTGDRFMEFCKSGQISNYCHPNALMTLAEYLADYASGPTREKGLRLIERELGNISSDAIRTACKENVGHILSGAGRDFRF